MDDLTDSGKPLASDSRTSSKPTASMAADLLAGHGVHVVFASPGSRNAPLLVAVARHPGLRVEMVVDERSAAYMALGYAAISGEPVALTCTSGTALLNYLPAVAEAYYRKIPLIVVSADRPEAWIDQDDSQTLHQPGALEPYVKVSCDLPDIDPDDRTGMWWANRSLNNAFASATLMRKGPVHVNLRFDAPLNHTVAAGAVPRVIEAVAPSPSLPTAVVRAMGLEAASPRRLLIVVGFMEPSQKLSRAIAKLVRLPNVAVIAENVANLHCRGAISRVDTVLASIPDGAMDEFRPDIVISMGGALVSRRLKTFLRMAAPDQHWHVGLTDTTIDCFQSLTRRIEMDPDVFFPQFASAMQPHQAESGYASLWAGAARMACRRHDDFVRSAPWSALKAFDMMVARMDPRWNVQVSNGTSVRYLQLADSSRLHRVDCNRGVSGIDGATSTAVGAQMASRFGTTVLFTGDMSLQYDLNPLGATQVSGRMKIVVMNNGGGGIFRFIPSTSDLPELDRCFVVDKPFPVVELATAWGWDVFEVADAGSLDGVFDRFATQSDRPAMLVVRTDSELDARVLNDYFDFLKTTE